MPNLQLKGDSTQPKTAAASAIDSNQTLVRQENGYLRLYFAELKRRDSLLWWVGILHIGLFFALMPGLFLDTRTVSGINPWIKPMKFDLSIAVYCWTMGWILAELSAPFHRKMSRNITLAMITEIVIITFQAARGVKSHFNISTSFDFAMYSIMGVAILYNTYLLVRITMRFFGPETVSLIRPAVRGIQLGLISILFGSVFGGVMVFHNGHAVGVADGGAGLPFLNWSTEGGDLRIAHFLGLHGLQFMLIAGYLLSSSMLRLSDQMRMGILYLGFIIYTTLACMASFWAWHGHPLIR